RRQRRAAAGSKQPPPQLSRFACTDLRPTACSLALRQRSTYTDTSSWMAHVAGLSILPQRSDGRSSASQLTLLGEEVDRVLLVIRAVIVEKVAIGYELLVQGHRPGTRVCLGIVNRQLDLQAAVIDAAESLGHPRRCGHRTAIPIEPGAVPKAIRANHQRVAFPHPNRVAIPRGV